MTATIIITISPQGEATVKTEGFAGARCKDASRFLEKALGKTVSEELTSEYFEQATLDNSLKTSYGSH